VGWIATGRRALQHQLAPQPLGFVASDDSVVVEIEPAEQLVGAFERLIAGEVRLWRNAVCVSCEDWNRGCSGDERNGAKESLHCASVHEQA